MIPGNMHPEMKVLLDARGDWPARMSVADIRAAWASYTRALWRPAPENLHAEDIMAPAPDGAVPVRRYHFPDQPSSAAVIYMHGGGFMKGSLDDSDAIAWGFAHATGAQVFSVDYRLAPEHPYPGAFNDCYAVLSWLAGGAMGVDPARIIVLGDSAGGNLAAALCLAARDRNGPSIAAQVHIYPGHGGDHSKGSYVEHAQAPLLTAAGVRQTMDSYTSGARYANDPYAQPLRASDYSNLPPAWIHSAEIDPIRDDGREFAARMALAGGNVCFREAKGMLHGFLRARFGSPAAAREFEAICQFVRSILA